MAQRKRGFGQISKMRSGRYQARYTGPDTKLHTAPATFDTMLDAEAWLTDERRLISAGVWTSPAIRVEQAKISRERPDLFGQYARRWIANRVVKGKPLAPRTRAHYTALLEHHIGPTFDLVPIGEITTEMIEGWHDALPTGKKTLRSHCYSLVRAILNTATERKVIPFNPCVIRGAGNAYRSKKIRPADLDELAIIVQNMPEQLKPMTVLASWCALRFGELIELRRKDIDTKHHVIRVRRGAVRADGEVVIGGPKSDAGVRDVAVPPHVWPMVEAHLATIPADRETLLFPAADGVTTMAPSTLYRHFYKARQAAGRPDLRWHDLRHTGAVLAAQTGATLAELMGRLGHSTPTAAMRYQHSAKGRDAEIAAAMSERATGVGN